MVRTECRKCKNALSGWIGCATLTIPVKEWIRSADWSGSVGSYIAEAENLCPGFVTHESGGSETQAPLFVPFIQAMEPMEPGTITFEQCQSNTNPVQISTQSNNGQTMEPAPALADTISVTPRKRSESNNGQTNSTVSTPTPEVDHYGKHCADCSRYSSKSCGGPLRSGTCGFHRWATMPTFKACGRAKENAWINSQSADSEKAIATISVEPRKRSEEGKALAKDGTTAPAQEAIASNRQGLLDCCLLSRCPTCWGEIVGAEIVPRADNPEIEPCKCQSAADTLEDVDYKDTAFGWDDVTNAVREGIELGKAECATGPWRTDTENAPSGIPVLVEVKGFHGPVVAVWGISGWMMPIGDGLKVRMLGDNITRFAVIGGK